ncbi:MerR family transcriptional regulator [Georgenia sp. SUBG003]|uniref:MerR family transcriptional regulator n=1 Tax=Georgenia sp. SUBG003 TaxID=1497974 RepID=UPI0004D6A2E1|nr:MerR family transcriptional regulator [Georgenia sp. SUBG003]
MSKPEQGPMMQIGKFADRSGVSIHTIRHYDEVGLLRPSGRSDGGFRLYTEEDLERFLVIRRMKPLGFSLEEMRQVLDVVDALPAATAPEHEALRSRLDGFIEAARKRRAKVLEQVAMADEFIGLLEERRRL